ncbi:uncharacterized protein DC041_0004530 [Schistosoma bovis]|uniref:Nuclear pore complex protein n=1 Tax=Schistosoma bovis TaxID=6184 RepID=A0A430Q438_SCHBO|nr:uncharacterized protein DC041_0004530 [Schistosoma bovis]
MDWLFYNPDQRGEALCLANSLLRVFIAMHSFKAAQQVLSKLPVGTLEHAKIICEKLGSPDWLVNTIREHECLTLYLESRVSFMEILFTFLRSTYLLLIHLIYVHFNKLHTNRPVQPSSLTNNNNFMHTTYGPRGLAQRLAIEESKKEYLARLERWRHDTRLDTEVGCELIVCFYLYLCL